MHKKTTYILIAIFVILAAGYFLQKNKENNEEKSILEGKNLISFDLADVNVIDIKMPKRNVVLEKKNNIWLMGKYPAIESETAKLFEDLKNATVVAIAAKNLVKLGEFNLGEDKAQEFTFKNNDKVLGKIIVGALNFNSGTVYVIKGDGKNILSVKNFSASLLESQWISLLVDKTEKTIVKKIEISEGERKTVVEKIQDEWKVNGKKANQGKVDDLLNRVTRITAAMIPPEGTTFANYDTKIAISTTASTTPSKILELGKKDDQGSYYIKNAEGLLFILDKETRDNLIRQASDLR